MYRREYELKRIEISEGTLNILFDKKNRHNLDIWKSTGNGGKSYAVNLKNIVISGTQIRVISQKGKFALLAFSDKTQFRGRLSGNILSGETKGNLRIKDLKYKRKESDKQRLHCSSLSIWFTEQAFSCFEGESSA